MRAFAGLPLGAWVRIQSVMLCYSPNVQVPALSLHLQEETLGLLMLSRTFLEHCADTHIYIQTWRHVEK